MEFKKIFIISSLILTTLPRSTALANETLTNIETIEQQEFPNERPIIPAYKAKRTPQSVILPKDSMFYKYSNSVIKKTTISNRSIIDDDSRQNVKDITKSPYNQIAKIICKYPSGNEYSGTGIVVSSDSVLTAAHNLYYPKERTFASVCEVAVGLKPSTSSSQGFTTGKKFLIPQKWINPETQYGSDFGMIKLDTKLGDITGGIGISSLVFNNETIETAGYPSDLNDNTMYFSKGNITAIKPEKFYHNIDTYNGQSGSPIWNSSQLLIGLHIAGTLDSPQPDPLDNQFNKAVRFTEQNYDYIRYWLNVYPGRVYGNSKEQITISKPNEKIWSNLQLSQEKSSTSNLVGKVFNAKYYYDLPNGNRYLSLYQKDGTLLGYINIEHINNLTPISYNKQITIKQKGYSIMEDTFFNSKKDISDNYIGKNFLAKDLYTLGNGRIYYSLFDSNNKLFGYININATQ